MIKDFCLSCGKLLPLHTYDCPTCGFDNRFGEYQDIPIDDLFLNNVDDDFTQEEELN